MLHKQLSGIRKREVDEGFTLVEVLVAMTVFISAFLTVPHMMTSAINGNAYTRGHTEAVTLARNRMEFLMNVPYDDDELTAGEDHYTLEQNTYTINWNVVDDTPTNNTKTINMTVTWVVRGTQRSISLDYIKTK